MNSTKISLAAARRLRNGRLPHIPPAAAPVSSLVTLALQAPPASWPEAVLTDTRRGMSWRIALQVDEKAPGQWTAELLLPQEPTIITYHFELAEGHCIREQRQVEGTNTPVYGVWEEQDFRIAAYLPQGAPPKWVRGCVTYQIFPDRFARGNPEPQPVESMVYGRPSRYLPWHEKPELPPKGRDFYGGTLRGVIESLDYLADLGISFLYMTPIFTSPTNHRYDTVDYFQIDPRLGDENDFRALVEAAAVRHIRVILDGVFNHCSKDNPFFKAAQRDNCSPYYRWFTFDDWPHGYVSWVGVPEMPQFVECPEVEEFFFGPEGVARYWLRTGIAGWRLDVVPWKSDEFWRRLRTAVNREREDVYLVAEDWGDASHRLLGDMFDATMNYRFAHGVVGYATGKLTPSELDDRLETLRRDTPAPAFHVQMNLLSSHDTARLLTLCGGDRARHALAAAMQLAYPGAPMIYYGDEVGLEGTYAEDGRRSFPWDAPDRELLAFYRTAIHIRGYSVALKWGDVKTVWLDDAASSYGFLRCYGEHCVLAVFNAGSDEAHLELTSPEVTGSDCWIDLLGRLPPIYREDHTLPITLPPLTAGWFTPEEQAHTAALL